ncbi:hypothetical protein [Streptomyces sp. UNOC14_S4]|uniref:hypothetical protein n=1 Tax=Streptomyces sp. UNOC14_S4 TaxID=2872340 RepID=UPI001E4D9608|nr:hypothetical protein [Streptomyces sp. UNOC14_S4]MCC3766029.1 hypothetical protein [Streptomyces sp. UNOC14_S4]
MPRGHGRIDAEIWDNPNFLKLDEKAQRLYLFLICQPDVTHTGVLPLTLSRWAQTASGLTPASLRETLQALAQADLVAVDHTTDELLICGYARTTRIWKQPRIMGAMVRAARQITSPSLRARLRADIECLPLSDLTDVSTSSGPSIRQQVIQHVQALCRELTPPTAPPSRTPSPAPSAAPSSAAPEVAPQAPALADQMLTAWWERYGRRTAQGRRSVHATIAEALDNGNDPRELWRAMERLGELSKPVTGGTLTYAYAELRKTSKPSGAPQLPNGLHPTGTDRRVADHYALIAEMDRETR